MLQRSPSFVLALPGQDPVADLLRRALPERHAYAAIRWKNERVATTIYRLCRRYPARARALLRRGVVRRLPPGFDVDVHFAPAYQPWEQRLCFVPDGDFFAAISSGKAEVVTDHIERFTPTGLRLRSGAELDADVIVTATGLSLLAFGGIDVTVDGRPVRVAEHVAWKGMMLDGVPNLAFALGYTNASWTLKVDLVSTFMARLVRTMTARGDAIVTPRLPSEPMETSPFFDMTSGYFARSLDAIPLQGDRAPWRLQQHYRRDARLLSGPVDAEELEFARRPALTHPH